jgi:sugar transferase EpsL
MTPHRLLLPAKRLLDVSWSLAALVLLSPVMLIVAIVVRISLGSPVIFRQDRPGLGGRPFKLYKFRTMRQPRPDEVWYLTDDERITRVGRLLRSSSLDELPELWNVLRGDMSLVGPRPLLMEYLDEYTPEERHRHDVRPGITGWAVVNGRNTLQFRDRLALDLWYVRNWSLLLDVRIILMTVAQVLRRESATPTEDLALGFPLPGTEAASVGQASDRAEPSPDAVSPDP